MRHVDREAFMKRLISGVFASVLAMCGDRGVGAEKASAETRRHPRHVRALCRHHRRRQRDRGKDGGGGFRRRGAGPQDRDHRRRPSQQGRCRRQHRARHARQSGRRNDLRCRGVRDRACRRRDRKGAQQDRDIQRPGLDRAHQRGLRSLHGALCLRYLCAGQCHRACHRQVRPRHLVLPDRRLCVRTGRWKRTPPTWC